MKLQKPGSAALMISVLMASGWLAGPVAQADVIAILPDATDAQVIRNSAGVTSLTEQGSYQARIGEFYAPGGAAYVGGFQVPTLPAGSIFTGATLRMQLFGLNSDAGHPLDFNADLYGLPARAAPDPLGSDYYQGAAADPNATLIQAAFLTPTSPLRTDPNLGPFLTLSSTGQTALLNYINGIYDGGAGAGMYALLRINPAVDAIHTGNNAWQILTQGAGGANEKPVLTLTYEAAAVPEPASMALLVWGGLVLLKRRH